MWVYIVCVETWSIRYDKLAKQNVSRVSRGKALPVRYSWKPVVTICHDSSHSNHVQGTCFTSQEGFSWDTRENFLLFTLPWVFTLSLTHILYKEIPHKIHGTYDWTKLQSNLTRNKSQHKIVVNHNFTILNHYTRLQNFSLAIYIYIYIYQ